MTTSVENPAELGPKHQKLFWMSLGLWGGAASILLYFHFAATLVKAHYQYVVLVPLLVAYLLWQRHTAGVLRYGNTAAYWRVGWIVCLIVLAGGSWLFSPWLGMAAIVMLGPLSSMALGGWPLLRTTWGVWLVGAFLLPLPLRYDERLIVWLRGVATRITSGVLDQLGVAHMVAGNVIELPEKKLFVADACSGIHSLFVLLCASAVVAVWNCRGPIATLFLFGGTCGLVLIENILRLLTVSLGIRWGFDLSEGTPHAVLGFILFGISLGLIISLDQWNSFFTLRFKTRDRKEVAAKEMSRDALKWFRVTGIAAMVCLPIQLIRMPSEIPNLVEGFATPVDLPSFGSDFLPESIGGFQRRGYEEVVRVADDPFGAESQIWRYSQAGTEITVSLNFPYRGLHDACLCYRNTGWNISNESIIGVADDGAAVATLPYTTQWESTPALMAKMTNPLEGSSLMLYSMLSESDQIGVKVDSRKLGSGEQQASGRFEKQDYSVPEQWVQLQFVAVQAAPFTEEETQTLIGFFRQVQGKLFERCKGEF